MGKEEGVPKMRYSPIQNKGPEIVAAYRSGKEVLEIADDFGFSRDGVRLYIRKTIFKEYKARQIKKWGKAKFTRNRAVVGASVGERIQCTNIPQTCNCSRSRMFRQASPRSQYERKFNKSGPDGSIFRLAKRN